MSPCVVVRSLVWLVRNDTRCNNAPWWNAGTQKKRSISPLDAFAVSTAPSVVDKRERGAITAENYEKAKQAELQIIHLKADTTDAPYLVDFIHAELLKDYSEEELMNGGLSVYPLDSKTSWGSLLPYRVWHKAALGRCETAKLNRDYRENIETKIARLVTSHDLAASFPLFASRRIM
jgi:hypothetical protein